jgi:hypothetical protein
MLPADPSGRGVYATCSNSVIAGSNPTRTIVIYISVTFLFMLLCVDTGFVTGRSLLQGVLPNIYKSVKFEGIKADIDKCNLLGCEVLHSDRSLATFRKKRSNSKPGKEEVVAKKYRSLNIYHCENLKSHATPPYSYCDM